MKTRIMSSIALLLLCVAYVCCDNPLSTDKPFSDGLGVNTHFTHPKDGEIKMIRDAGFKIIRQDFNWENTEKAKGVYTFGDYEYLVKQLEDNDITPYFTLDYSNKLYEKHRSVTTEAGRQAYAKWAAAAVKHFKGKGIVWEIWNEPNVPKFWGENPKVEEYSAMAQEAVKAMKAVGPNEIVVGPATLDFKFTETCLKEGLNKLWDAISIHPYRNQEPESVMSTHRAMKELIAKYKANGKTLPVLSGEWGYSSIASGQNDAKQAKYLQRMMLTSAMDEVPITIWYDWHDDGDDKTNNEHNFGIVKYAYKQGKSPVYDPKDAYTAAKTMNTALKGFKFVARLETKNTKDFVLLFKNDKQLRVAAWSETANSTHSISIPSDKCDFQVTPYLGSPVQKASSTGGSLQLTISDSPHFVAPQCAENKALENAPRHKGF